MVALPALCAADAVAGEFAAAVLLCAAGCADLGSEGGASKFCVLSSRKLTAL